MDDAFSCLFSLSSYVAHQFFQFIEDLLYGDAYLLSEDFWVLSSARPPDSASFRENGSVPGGRSSSFTHLGPRRSLGLYDEKDLDVVENSSMYSRLDFLLSRRSNGGVNFILKGLMLPLITLRYFWSLAVASWRSYCRFVSCLQAKAYSIMFRMSKTLQGSTNDIGWLQRDPEMAPVTDGTARFLQLLERIRNGEHSLPDSFVYLLIPGLFSNHGPLYFVATKRFFSKMGLACHIAKIHSEASVEHNAWELKQYIEELYWGSGKRVMLLGHSKGGVDAAAALSLYWQDLKNKVVGLALVQSPYGGTPIASDILREGQIADKETRRIMEFLICKIIKGDIRALEDLTYERRKEFINKHKLPDSIPIISFHSEASAAPGVLATMTHIAHAELPWLPLPSFGRESPEDVVHVGRQVPVVVPVSAVMALCALHLKLRYGEKSDGLVTCRDAEVPGSVVVRPDRKLDHTWMVYSSWKRDPAEADADACEMCEALLTLLVQLGRKRKKEE